MQLVQELNDALVRRVQFCEYMNQRLMNNPHSLSNIVVSKESTFYMNGTVISWSETIGITVVARNFIYLEKN